MIPSLWILVNLLLLLLSAAATATAYPAESQAQSYQLSNGTTVYELLPKFGLPPGLLPDTVTSFSLAQNGAFEVNLTSICYINFEYLVFYEPRITGIIRYGEIDELQGIQVRRFLVWFNVDAIKVDLPPSQYIYFDVGWITKKLFVEQFKSIHSCQKGLAESMMEQTAGLYRLSEDGGMRLTEKL